MKVFTINSTILWCTLTGVSGAAALSYQVAWQRWLALTTGSSAGSLAIVVAAFLSGLSLGALVGGSHADRLGRHWGWLLFAALEAGIAVCALASRTVLYDWLPLMPGLGPEALLRTYAVVFVLLLVPTWLMGMALPILAASIRLETPFAQAGFISRLMFANTIGASAGALLMVFVLAPAFGFDGAVRAAAVANLLTAAVAVGAG